MWFYHSCQVAKRQQHKEVINISNIKLMQGDCLERMKEIPDGSIDMVLTDPPYGTTACKWDIVIPFEPMWEQLKRIIKPNGAIVMMAGQPFTSALVMSNLKQYKTSWVWNKRFGANFGTAKYHPMKIHEDVVVFCKKTAVYSPQMVKRVKPIKLGKNVSKRGSANLQTAKKEFNGKVYTEKFPESILEYSTRAEGQVKQNPTQKPVALMEYLIKTYTNEGETVLDFTMGSGTTGVACVKTDRDFIGIELDETQFKIAQDRISL
jgi:site-specific DNA-methyltransferase (adenine-specific)